MVTRHIRLLVIGLALWACTRTPGQSQPNRQQGARSPSGKYVVRVQTEPQTAAPYSGTAVWKVTISDPSGKVLYKDEGSTMVSALRVYWGWGNGDRLWLYSSDDGRIWRWEPTDHGWKKRESKRSEGIPDFVLPDYAKRAE